MAHEIHYTSCPQGLRPMSRGLCTVAASDGIPPALWERLEALSGYRHHFDPEDARNPVAHAHWILYIGGREYHVLSRIADSGFDYTRRNNSFAHHIAVDPDERPPAGPAWMLAQPGVMATRWDGQVGPLHRAMPLPYGDGSTGPCHAWQRIAGDAGWAGVLAQAFSDQPSKPVHIIYSPEQSSQMLELIREAIAILPASQRWNVTFHTYFTSMPGNVQCAWRCCLAGTHAAIAARGSGTGLVIDLSRPDSLGAPPEGAWVSRARTGSAVPTKHEPAPTVARLSKPAHSHSKRPAPIPLAEEPPPLPPSELIDPAILHPAPYHPAPPPPASANGSASRGRNLLILYLLACLAMAMGIWMLVLANRPATNNDPVPIPINPTPPPDNTSSTSPVTPPTSQGTVVIAQSRPIIKTTPRTVIKPPETQRVVETQPIARPKAQPYVLAKSLERMSSGSGIGSKAQSIPVPREALDTPDAITRLAILFPVGQEQFAYKDSSIVGQLWCEPESTAAGPSLSLHWKDGSGAGMKMKVLTLALEKPGPMLKVAWNTSAMLRNPDVQVAAYWVLQNSQVMVSGAQGETIGRLLFKPIEVAPVKLLAAAPAIAWPNDFPSGALPRTNVIAPAGWTAACEPQWDAKDNGKKAPENATHAIRLQWEGNAEVAFAVTVPPGWNKAETDFAAKRKTMAGAVEKAATELALIASELQRIDADARADLDPLEKKVSEFTDMRKLTNVELETRGVTRPYINNCIHNLQQQIKQRSDRHREAVNMVAPRKTEAERLKDEADRGLEAMNRLAGFDLDLELSENLRLGRLRFDLSAR